MEKIKNKLIEEIIKNKHNLLQSQETQNQKEIADHKQDTTKVKENFNELKTEI